MKKLVCILAFVLSVCLTACAAQAPAEQSGAVSGGAQSQVEQSVEQKPEQSAQPQAEHYVFHVNNVDVAINDDMAEVLAKIGQPISYFQAASCAFEGLDKTYTYAGFVITTRPDKEKDYVNSILLTDDSNTTVEGIYLGSTKENAVTAYGDQGVDLGTVLTYTKGDTKLNLIITDGKVSSIEYLPA